MAFGLCHRPGHARRSRHGARGGPENAPLFTIKGDDPLAVPEILGFEWAARAYPKSRKEAVEPVALENKLAATFYSCASVSKMADGRAVVPLGRPCDRQRSSRATATG